VALPVRPTRLGPYDVIVKIAGGGMATIYLGRARDAKGGGRLVALKAIRHDFRHDERFIHMFRKEAAILSRLSHPNIAATYEVGMEEDQHFIAMELLVGRTLSDAWDACKARNLTLRLDHAAWVAARVGDALHHAHELTDESGAPIHLVHRDVNPSNVFLTFEGEVKLFDFGLAKATALQEQSSADIVKGKLPYLSPEQLTQLPIDRRSDVYTLGTTLWEMTTMRRLFKRDDDSETLIAVRAGLVPDPRARVPAYPESLWSIVHRALARDREDRYPTADALARDLDRFAAVQASAEDYPALTRGILDALFPGEREERTKWIRRASTVPGQVRSTPPAPPAVVRSSTPPPPPPRSRGPRTG
jgi:serine/threonine protein kinase